MFFAWEGQLPNKRTDIEKKCGLVMPISGIDGCDEAHWQDVKSILEEAVVDAGFEPNLVSNADDVGVIQKRIIQNLYENPIIVCDVSGKNPNVMFELGIRLAFDKPTIIVKDDKTDYSFDTAPIEHVSYPRDLRFGEIVNFKKRLKEKIVNTYNLSQKDESYTTFLKNFGEFKVAKIDEKEMDFENFVLDELKDLKILLTRYRARPLSLDRSRSIRRAKDGGVDICLAGFGFLNDEPGARIAVENSHEDIMEAVFIKRSPSHWHMKLEIPFAMEKDERIIVDAAKEAVVDFFVPGHDRVAD